MRTDRGSIVIEHGSVVVPEGILEGASIRIEDGVIMEIRSDGFGGNGRRVDARGCYVLPGFIDLHSDAIEKEIEPRPNALFPVAYALFELDKKLVSCGVTTIFHSLSFAELEVGLRSNNMAAAIVRQVNDVSNRLNARTRIHTRYEITDSKALPCIDELIRDGQVHLVSLMDHTPGQGQFREITSFKGYYGKVYQKSDKELDSIIARKLKAKETSAAEDLCYLIGLARRHNIAVASHDDDSSEKVSYLSRLGVRLSEFPINMEAVVSARENGVSVCLGAPNIFRGNSTLSNLNAREAIGSGYGDIICSDYAPTTILHAMFALTRSDMLTLPQAVNMASLNPARAVGMETYVGSIEEGKEGDIVVVDAACDVPRILKTFIAGTEVFSTC